MTGTGFTVAVVTGHSPVEVSIQHFVLDIDPDDFFTTEGMPRGRGYGFDAVKVQYAVEDAGYEPTSCLQWTGTHWAYVVQPKTNPADDPRWHPEKLPPLRAWEQGGYEEDD
jgi:hypothetical protein